MESRPMILGVTLALLVSAGAEIGSAASRMVGVVPSDGIAMFVKSFPVSAGTTILGAEFENNDPRTIFPEVVLLRGVSSAIVDGAVVARATNVGETAPGRVQVLWSAPVQVGSADVYYVGVRIPQGSCKQGPGNGPALGATDVARPNGSFLASGSDSELTPAGVDLAISLITAGLGKAGAPTPEPTETQTQALRTFLRAGTPNPASSIATIEFGLERTSHVRLNIYDVAGRVVRKLADETIAGGVYSRHWDGRDTHGNAVGAGVYIAKLQAGDKSITQKLVLAK